MNLPLWLIILMNIVAWLIAFNAIMMLLPHSRFVNWCTRPVRAAMMAFTRHHSYGYVYKILAFMDKAEREGATKQELLREAYKLSEHYPEDYDRHVKRDKK